MSDIYAFLESHGIAYQRFDHPAVFTCEEADKLCPDMPGSSMKNLFLRDKSGAHHFIVAVPTTKSVDLAALKEKLGVSKLSFASSDRLQEYLGVTPGSVTLLGLMNDHNHAVQVIIDEELMGNSFQCHPIINTATLVISQEGIMKFLEKTGHTYQVLAVPARA